MGKITAKCQETKELLLCLSELSQEEPIAYFKNKGISTAVLNQGKEKGWLEFIESERYRYLIKTEYLTKRRHWN